MLDFLAKIVREFNIQGMKESQAFRVLPDFLSGFARNQFRSVSETMHPDQGGIDSWPEAVQWLLRSYATNNAVRTAILELRDVQQLPQEAEKICYMRLTDASNRCGNVHSVDELATMFVDGLDSTTKTVVARYRESHRRVSFLELVEYAQAEGDAVRARSRNMRRATLDPRPAKSMTTRWASRPTTRSNPIGLLQSSADSDGTVQRPPEGSRYDGVNLAQEAGHYTSEPSFTEEPSTSQEKTAQELDIRPYEPALALDGRNRGHTDPGRVPFSDGRTIFSRPGWGGERPRSQKGLPHAPSRYKMNLICHECYAKGHIKPDCLHPLRDREIVISNYNGLTPQEKASVPAVSYLRIKALLSADAAGTPASRSVTDPPPATTVASQSFEATTANAEGSPPDQSKN